MRKAMMVCLCGLLLAGMASLASAEKEYNLYDYNPMELKMRWVYALRSSQGAGEQTVDVEVIGDQEHEGIPTKRIRRPSGWAGLYEASKEGLRCLKDVYKKNERYVVYGPGAILYPKTMKMGQVYESASLRKDYSGADDALGVSSLERLRFSLLAEEDIATPAGEFKGCLKTLSITTRYVDAGEDHKTVVISWNAPGVGVVKKITLGMLGEEILYIQDMELKEFVKP